jgi:hypothetical protein
MVMHQKRIQIIQAELNKVSQAKAVLQPDYQQARDMLEMLGEKSKVLEETVASLKKELHT